MHPANADFIAASAYHFAGIATPLLTPLFVCAGTSGWYAHVIEQRADNRMILPGSSGAALLAGCWALLLGPRGPRAVERPGGSTAGTPFIVAAGSNR